MQGGDGEFFGNGVWFENGKIGDEERRAGGSEAELAALDSGGAVAERGEEIEFLDHGAGVVAHDDEDSTAGRGDFGSSAGAGKADFRTVIVADDGAVEVAEAIDLRATEEPDGDAAALEPVAEHFGNGDGGEGGAAELAVTDGEREHRGARGDGAGFVDEDEVGGVSQAGKVAGGGGQADADEADVAVRESAGRGDGHHFVGGVVHVVRRAWTFSLIHWVKEPRSREIASQFT